MSHDGNLQNFTSVHPRNQRLSLRSRRLEVTGAGKNKARGRETRVSPSRAPFFLRLRQFTVPSELTVTSDLTATGGHLGFKCKSQGVGGGGGKARKIASFETVPYPLSRFDTHPQTILVTLETKMAACKGRRMITTILRKNRGL